MNEFQSLVLKGRHIIARGKRRRSVAVRLSVRLSSRRSLTSKPGFECKSKNRPRDIGHKRGIFISDEMDNLYFEGNIVVQFRPRRAICFVYHVLADGFWGGLSLPRVAFRFVPPETLPWAKICWPFRPNGDMLICI